MNMTAIHGNITGIKRLVFECFEALPLFFKDKPQAMDVRLRGGNKGVGPGIRPGGRGNDVIFGEDAQVPSNPPLISNRWQMRQIPDPVTYLNSTEITGKAVFRLDILSRLGYTADQLRKYIMPPLATGYIRIPPVVTQGSVGNEVLYTIIDQQQMLNNPAGQRWGVHSVGIIDSCHVNNPVDIVSRRFKEDRGRG